MNAAPQRGRDDKFRVWPAVAGIVIYGICIGMVAAWSLVGFAFVLVILGVACLAWLVALFALLVRRRFRSVISVMVVPIVVLLLKQPLIFACDIIHLIVCRAEYSDAIRLDAKSGQLKFAAFDWSVGFAGGESTFLLFDQSDKISMLNGPMINIHVDDHGFGPLCAGRVQHLLEHYYVCRF